jgi:thymidylate synthase
MAFSATCLPDNQPELDLRTEQKMDTATSVWLTQMDSIVRQGDCVKNTVELLGSSLCWDMRYPVVMNEARKINYAFMAAEAAYIISGRNDVAYLMNAMKSFGTYSDDGYHQTGAYGPAFIDQLPYVVDILNKDPESRQAVINIWRNSPRASKDIPCTLSLQFFIRDERIHTVVNMRSSDAYRGLIYDLFCFSAMAAVVAGHLNDPLLDLGTGYLNMGSSHLYGADLSNSYSLLTDGALVSGPRLVVLNRIEMFHVLDPLKTAGSNALAGLFDAFPDELNLDF